MKSILSLGAVYLDINGYHFPIPEDVQNLVNTETVGNEYEMTLGGSALNVVRFCKLLGLGAFFIGKTGQDNPSNCLENLFKEENITPLLIRNETVQTNINTNLVDDSGRSIMLSFGNANQSLSAHDVFEEIKHYGEKIDYFYLGGVFKLKQILPSLPEIVLFLKENQKKVVLDHGRIINGATETEKELVRNLVESVDYYLPSKDEFLELWHVKTIEEGLRLFEKTSLTVVVKDAENGAWTLIDNKIVNSPAFSVTPVNTIGAGDSFNAGLIAGLSENKFLEDAIGFANATAALKISTNKFPSKDEIESLLQG